MQPCLIPSLILLLGTTVQDTKVNFNDQVSAVFRSRCNSCHNADQKKGGLNLETYTGLMQGGGSGAAIEPGDPDSSWLYLLVSHQEEPKMPPNSPRIPDAELETIRKWIEAGAPETAGSKVAMPKKKNLEIKLDPSAMGKPSGEPAMPQGVATEPAITAEHSNPVIAMATSPWAPLVAIGGHKQVLLYDTDKLRLVGVLPYPEGTVHGLKFSRDGDLLLAAGGRGANLGRVIVWDVKTGERMFEVGKEYDIVLSADISPDRSMIALGGPSKILRVYGTADGELIYENKKHTEWVTSVAFSPDGVLLASGDRNGGLLVWEAVTGREFYDLRGHSQIINDLSWRIDANVLASASGDGSVRLWDMINNGNQIKSWGAHGGGTESIWFAQDGRLVSSGRDRTAKQWKPDGAGERTLEAFPEIVLRAAYTHDGSRVIAADFSGQIRIFNAADGAKIGELPPIPQPVAVRLDQTRQELIATQAQLDELAKAVEPLQKAAEAATAAAGQAQQALTASEQVAAQAAAAVPAAEQAIAARTAAIEEATGQVQLAVQSDQAALEAWTQVNQAVVQATQEARAAAEAAAADPNPEIQARAATAEQARLTAQQTAISALGRLVDAGNALQASRSRKIQSLAEKTAAEQALAAAKTAQEQANTDLAQKKAAFEQANAGKTAADQALAERAPAFEAAKAKVDDLQAYVNALTAELQAMNPAPTAASNASPTGNDAG